MSAGGNFMRPGNTGRRWYPNARPDKEKGQKEKKKIVNKEMANMATAVSPYLQSHVQYAHVCR